MTTPTQTRSYAQIHAHMLVGLHKHTVLKFLRTGLHNRLGLHTYCLRTVFGYGNGYSLEGMNTVPIAHVTLVFGGKSYFNRLDMTPSIHFFQIFKTGFLLQHSSLHGF